MVPAVDGRFLKHQCPGYVPPASLYAWPHLLGACAQSQATPNIQAGKVVNCGRLTPYVRPAYAKDAK